MFNWRTFIASEVLSGSYDMSVHADDERLADGLTVEAVEEVLTDCEILEDYIDDPRGRSCLACGYSDDGRPVHVICGKNASGHLVWITVYIPKMPKWRDPQTRNRC